MTNSSKVVHILEETRVERDLGVYFNNKLSWPSQINNVKTKAYTLGTWKPEKNSILDTSNF